MINKRQSVESTIRDWLAIHLDFIEPRLKLVKKEHFLKDTVGSSGFVDLLCSDGYNNFVVIEIKRSDNSSRQTISEILKYHSLIKSNYGARESEIRTIVISTHWNELIRPFSETVHRTSLDLKGYLISIDEKGIPNSIKNVEPLSKSFLSRKFAYWQGLYLFATKDTQEVFYRDFKKRILNNLLIDFVLVKATGNLQDRRVIFPYGVIMAFQKLSGNELLATMQKIQGTGILDLEQEVDFDDEIEYLGYLESSLVNALDTLSDFEEGETCYPQKFNTLVNAEQWCINEIERFGIFKEDPRYTEELLLGELMGLDGDNENVFFAVAESSQSERINEIIEQCRYSLQQSPYWLNTIDLIMAQLKNGTRKFRLWIQVFNQQSLLVSIYHAITKKELGYMPGFFLSIDFLDNNDTEIYIGDIRWNGKMPTAKFLKPLDKKDDRGEWVFGLFQDPKNDLDAMKMSLHYAISKHSISHGSTSFDGFFTIDEELLKIQTEYIYPFEQFALTYQDLLKIFIANFNRTYQVMK